MRTAKRSNSWSSKSCSSYVIPKAEELCPSTVNIKSFMPGLASQEGQGISEQSSIWTTVAGNSVELPCSPVQRTSSDNKTDDCLRFFQGDRQHVNSSQRSSPGQPSPSRWPRASVKNESTARESPAAASCTPSPKPYKETEDEAKAKHTEAATAYYSPDMSTLAGEQKEGEKRSSLERRLSPAASYKELHSVSLSENPHNDRFSNPEFPQEYYGVWKPSACATATAGADCGLRVPLGCEEFHIELFTNVQNEATFTAAPHASQSDATTTAAEAAYVRTALELSPTSDNREKHNDQQLAVQKQQPVPETFLEGVDTVQSRSHVTFPGFDWKTLQVHEDSASTLTDNLGTMAYQQPGTQYLTPMQHPDFCARPLQSSLLHPYLPPLTADQSLPFLLPPSSPSGQGDAADFNPSQTSPSSMRLLAGSLLCCSLPACETLGARDDVRFSVPTSPRPVNLPGSTSQSPRFEDSASETSHFSRAMVGTNGQTSLPGDSATQSRLERDASAELPESVAADGGVLALAAPSPCSQANPEFLPPEQCHTATDFSHRPCFPPIQRFQLIEAAGVTKSEPDRSERSSLINASTCSHRSGYFDSSHEYLVERETGLLKNHSGTAPDPQNSPHAKQSSPMTSFDAVFSSTEDSPWADARRLTKQERLPADNVVDVKIAPGSHPSAQAPSSERDIVPDAKSLVLPTCISVSPPAETEGLPPLLLGRNTLPLALEERKSHSHVFGSTVDHQQHTFVQSAGPLPTAQEAHIFAARQTELTGAPSEPSKLQPDACSDWPQHMPPLAIPHSDSDEVSQPVGVSGSSFPLLLPPQIQQPFQYACTGAVETSTHPLVADSAIAGTHELLQQATVPTSGPQQVRVPHQELAAQSLPVVGPPTLLGSYPSFALPNPFWETSRQVTDPSTDQVGQPVYEYPNVLTCPLLTNQHPSNLQDPEATAFAAFNCGLQLPPPWISDPPPENVLLGPAVITSASTLQRHTAPSKPLSPRQLSDAVSYIPHLVTVPSVFSGARTDISLDPHTQTGRAQEPINFKPLAHCPANAALSLSGPGEDYQNVGVVAARNAGDPNRCSLRLVKSTRKKRLLQNTAPPEAACREHKDFLLELLACSLEPVKGVHMDRLRKTWVASWLVGKRRVTRIFSFQKFGFFGAREQAIRQRREALLNPELESEEAQRVVTAAAAAAAAITPDASEVCTTTAGAGAEGSAAETHQATNDPDRRLVQKIADSLPFVVGVTYHGESFSWIANHRKPMGKIVARRRFSIAEYGFLEARRRAAVMMFHWHKQGRVVEPEDYDQGAAAIFNAQQRPQLPDAANSEGFVYWYPACTANEPLYLMAAFDEESCDEAMVLLASICGNPWKKVCKGQSQGGVEEMLISGGGTAATARFVSSFHSEDACMNWYLSNSQRRERSNNIWERLKKERHHLEAGGICLLSPRKRLKCSAVSRRNSQTRKCAALDIQGGHPLKSFLASPVRARNEPLSKTHRHALCKDASDLKDAEDDNGCREEKDGSGYQATFKDANSLHTVSYIRKDAAVSSEQYLLVSSRMRERAGGIRKKAVLERRTVSAAHICSIKETPSFCSSTYWTRRKQAEQSATEKNESNTKARSPVNEENPSGGERSAFHRPDIRHQRDDVEEQPHSAQEVLRACFSSESASVTCSATASSESKEADAMQCPPPFVEAAETGSDTEVDDTQEYKEKEEVEEEVDQEEEHTSALTFQDTASVSALSVGEDSFVGRDSESRRLAARPSCKSRQPSSQNTSRERSGLERILRTGAVQEECCSEDLLRTEHSKQGYAIDTGATSLDQATYLLESGSWSANSSTQNVTLSQQHPEDFDRDFHTIDSTQSSLLPAIKGTAGLPSLYAMNNSLTQHWRAKKERNAAVCSFNENADGLPGVHSGGNQACSTLLLPQTQLCANVPFECSDAASLPCRMELVVHDSVLK